MQDDTKLQARMGFPL